MKIGIFYDNLNVSDDLSKIRLIKKIGYDYTELDYEKYVTERNLFRANSLPVSLYCFLDENCRFKDGTPAESILPLLREDGIDALMVVCRGREGEIIKALNPLCEQAEKYGITILAEDFDGKDVPCGSCKDMLRFASAVPKLRFTLDTGNFMFFGEDLTDSFEKLNGKIRHVHLKDRAADMKDAATGKGILPLADILNRLKATGYDNRISVEMFGVDCTEAVLTDALNFARKNI